MNEKGFMYSVTSQNKGGNVILYIFRDGDFADFFFSASNLPHFCGFLQFRALIREREKC